MNVQWIKLLPNLILNTFTKNGKQTQRMFGTVETCVGNVCLLWVHSGSTGLKPSTTKHRLFFNSYFSSAPPLFFLATLCSLWGLCSPPICTQSLQSCPTLCNPMDCSPPGSFVRGILQARTLEWVAISSSRRSSWDQTCISYIAGRFFTH